MKTALLLAALCLAGCSSDPVLYDGQRHIVVYCSMAKDHISYLEGELKSPKTPEFVSKTKQMIWDIRSSCSQTQNSHSVSLQP